MPRSRTVDQRQFDKALYADAAVAADGSNATLVTITFRNANGKAVPGARATVMLSDSAAGIGVTGTAASGTVDVKTAGTLGTTLGTLTAKKALDVQANASGVYALSITDTAKTAFKVAVIMDGIPDVVATLATASYG
jgi:hypothetical protein